MTAGHNELKNNIFLYIYNTGNVPEDDAGIINRVIRRQHYYIASQRKYSWEKGFLWGPTLLLKVGLGMFLGFAGVAKSQNCILVHGQLVVKKHLSVPRHYLPVHK